MRFNLVFMFPVRYARSRRDVKLSAGKILISGVASHATDLTNKLTKHR